MDEETRAAIESMLLQEIQMLYDDPYGIEGSFSFNSWIGALKKVAGLVGVDWDQAVLENSTEFERQRLKELWDRE